MKNIKALGQHWLQNRQILDQIATLATHEGINTCLEIGPGLGTLTSSLLKHFSTVISIEVDQNLARNLPRSFPGKNLTVINQDFLDFNLNSISLPYVVAGNIPYYITSPIIQKLLLATNPPVKIVLLVQKEVAERLAQGIGKHTVLSLFAQNYAQVELGPVIPKSEFTPPPKVDSQVVILTPHAPIIPHITFSLIKIGFSAPRKKLLSNLAAGLRVSKVELQTVFTKLHLNLNARPADLSLKDWKTLAEILQKR